MIEPFFFGNDSRLLFGVYHTPEGTEVRDVGVVLCYPMGQEYIRSHRVFLQLARLLASTGFHVLRFDFWGCGDSDGACDEGRPALWVQDIVTAIDELKNAGVARICLVGLRLGATLAVLCASRRDDIEAVVLWEPIIDGSAYVHELKRQHRRWLTGSFVRIDTKSRDRQEDEVLGFVLTAAQIQEVQGIDVFTCSRKLAPNIYVVETDQTERLKALVTHLTDWGGHVDYLQCAAPSVWLKEDDGGIPMSILERIVRWLSESCKSAKQ